MKQIRIYYFISLVPWFVFTNSTPILHSLSELLCHPCSFSLCVLKIEPGRKSPTLNAVFTNSKRQILQVIYLNIGMLNALKFNERDAVLCISSTKNTSYSLIKKKKLITCPGPLQQGTSHWAHPCALNLSQRHWTALSWCLETSNRRTESVTKKGPDICKHVPVLFLISCTFSHRQLIMPKYLVTNKIFRFFLICFYTTAYHIQCCSCGLCAHAPDYCRSEWCVKRMRKHWHCHLLSPLSPCQLVGDPEWSDVTVHQSASSPDEAVQPPGRIKWTRDNGQIKEKQNKTKGKLGAENMWDSFSVCLDEYA